MYERAWPFLVQLVGVPPHFVDFFYKRTWKTTTINFTHDDTCLYVHSQMRTYVRAMDGRGEGRERISGCCCCDSVIAALDQNEKNTGIRS